MPLGESMISTIKSNKSIMLDKSRRFRKTLGGYDSKEKPEYDFPKATPELLENIRLKIKHENRKATIKGIITFFIVALIICLVMFI